MASDGPPGLGQSPMDLINWASGRSLTSIATSGLGGWLIAIAASVITGTQWLLELLVVTPASVLTDVAVAAGDAILIGPLDVVNVGSSATADAVAAFEFLALPIAVALVLGTLYGVSQYLEREDTSDAIPGILIDVIPFVGVDEEEE